LTFEEDISQSLSSSPDNAHAIATQREADDVWPGHLAVPSAVGASTAAEPREHGPKGKEKAIKKPLQLLDLPVDVLKEIVHQVRLTRSHAHVAVRLHHALC
jgi:hypothetical protein